MKSSFLIIALAFLAACNSSTNESGTTDKDTSSKNNGTLDEQTADDFEGCYRRVMQRDTVYLRLLRKGDALSGTLRFDNYEKDASRGTVEGKVMKDGKAMLWYAFMSEGMNSVSQILLKAEDGGVTMGVGDIQMRGDTAVFKNPDAVTFDKKEALKRLACN